MENIKIIIWGFGAMGRGMAEMLLAKTGVEITGICDINPEIVGKNFLEVLKKALIQMNVQVPVKY